MKGKKGSEQRPNEDLLQSCFTNIQTGIVAIDYLIPEATSQSFIAFVSEQRTSFKMLEDRCKALGLKNKITLKPNNWFKNMKMWFSIKMGSFGTDDSQRLGELMIMGNFFGTIDLIKAIADASKAKPEILQLARDLKTLEEDCINKLIPYLERTKK